jgi:hypothetical protein
VQRDASNPEIRATSDFSRRVIGADRIASGVNDSQALASYLLREFSWRALGSWEDHRAEPVLGESSIPLSNAAAPEFPLCAWFHRRITRLCEFLRRFSRRFDPEFLVFHKIFYITDVPKCRDTTKYVLKSFTTCPFSSVSSFPLGTLVAWTDPSFAKVVGQFLWAKSLVNTPAWRASVILLVLKLSKWTRKSPGIRGVNRRFFELSVQLPALIFILVYRLRPLRRCDSAPRTIVTSPNLICAQNTWPAFVFGIIPIVPAAALALGWLTSGELTGVNPFGLSTVEIELSGAFSTAAA